MSPNYGYLDRPQVAQVLAILVDLRWKRYIMGSRTQFLRWFLFPVIKAITSLSWLALKSKGAIFLVGKDPEVLEMKAYRSIDSQLLEKCNRVPFGKCLCGRAAKSAEIQFAGCVNGRHEIGFDGMSPHGHYCVPIISGSKKILGVITLYVKEGHSRDHREENLRTHLLALQ